MEKEPQTKHVVNRRRRIVNMDWFKKIFSVHQPEPSPLSEEMRLEDEKGRRIALLSDDEKKAFEWFRLGYTARGTAETMLLDRRTAKRLFSSLFHKLGVTNETEVCKLYRTISLEPEDLPEEEDNL